VTDDQRWAAGEADVEAPAGGAEAEAQDVHTGHPAVDAALQAMANAADLPPDDQIAQYEATHRILNETLATIDEA
jgi:hypothetical protein